MIVRISLPIALLALCGAGPVLAAPSASNASQPEAVNSGSEVICRVELTPGSRFGKRRVCLTRDQWRMQRQAQREEIERAQTRRHSAR